MLSLVPGFSSKVASPRVTTALHTCKAGSSVARRGAVLVQARKEKETGQDDDDNDDDIVLAEDQLKARRNRKRRKLPQAGASDGKPAPLTPEAVAGSRTETIVLQSLAIGFFIILLQGISLAASGFLPEAADNFIVDYIYPSFSYQLGFFFTCSTAYGLWKTSSTSAD